MSEKKKNYNQRMNKWINEHYKVYTIKFHGVNQSDIIQHLESQPNKAGYIARLIREDMERQGIETKKKFTIADIMDEIKDTDYVQIIYPDNSSLATTKEGVKKLSNRVVDNYIVDEHINGKTFIIKVRNA